MEIALIDGAMIKARSSLVISYNLFAFEAYFLSWFVLFL